MQTTTRRISLDVDPKDHKAFKVFATMMNYRSLRDFFIEAAKEKMISDQKKVPNMETLKAFYDSDNKINLNTHTNIDELFDDLES